MDRSADALIGRVLDGRYRVGPKIARGGMATVFEATDLRLDRTVAVKIMHEGLADDEEFVRRFQREARSAARLSHPNVVSVFDTGDDGGTLFLVMEYVPGLTLRDLIRKEAPMSPARALAVLEPVLSALSAAHRANLVHRDVKPENVLLADDGRVKVADFGLSRAINADTQHTATGGVLIGTVSYLSPELVVNGRADARTDVYAVGVLLYEMLTGHKPHQADNPIQVAYKHVHEDIPAPSESVRGIPAYLDALVARATARDPDLRPADAGVLLHQVRRVRHALDHGVADDPELTADLAPTIPVVGERVPTGELPDQIVEPYDVPAFLADDEPEAARPAPPPVPVPVPGREHQRRSRRGPVALAIVVLLALVAAGLGYYFGIARYTTTPGVINLSESAARARLDRAGLDMQVTGRTHSETVARGSVVRTDPAPGDRVAKDGTVDAVLSLGPERHAVPDVHGKSLDDAQQALARAHLSFGQAVEKFSNKVPQDMAIATDPAAGTKLRRDTAVDVVVSKGPRPIRIPDFTGKRASTAERKLTRLGFEVRTSEENSDSVPKGVVVSQTPSSGTGQKHDPIALVVSKGPVLVSVPNTKGMGVDAATQRLEAAGFQVKVVHSALYVGVQYVVSSDPSAGTRAPKGSTVTISIV